MQLARSAAQTQLAITQLTLLYNELMVAPEGSELTSTDWKVNLQLEEAETLWAWDERTLAIRGLRWSANFAANDPSIDAAPILRLLGKFISEERVSGRS